MSLLFIGVPTVTSNNTARPPISVEPNISEFVPNKPSGKECLICDMLEFKTDTTGKLPLAKPGVQRRADERELRCSDAQAPIVQQPSSSSFSPASNINLSSNEANRNLVPSSANSTVPIPLGVTGGFGAGNISTYDIKITLEFLFCCKSANF